MKYLLISLSTLLLACTSYPKKHQLERQINPIQTFTNPYFSDLTKDYIYKAKINFAKKSFGGLVVVKKIAKNHHRVVFTTEMGNKLFDFSIYENNFKINFILAEMNKKMLTNLLKQDFFILTHENPIVTNQYRKASDTLYGEVQIKKNTYFYLLVTEKLHQIIETKSGNKKSDFTFSKIEHHHARDIKIKHDYINLTIDLKAL